MHRRHVVFDDFDDALNRVYQRFQELYVVNPSGRVAVTARTNLPTGDIETLCNGPHGTALKGFLSLLPDNATLSVSPGSRYDVFTIAW